MCINLRLICSARIAIDELEKRATLECRIGDSCGPCKLTKAGDSCASAVDVMESLYCNERTKYVFVDKIYFLLIFCERCNFPAKHI